MAYELEDIQKSQQIFYYLLAHHALAEEEQTALLQELQAEMTIRRTLLEHVDMPEDKLLETEEIIAAFQKRLDNLQKIKRQLLNQQETLSKEYHKLEKGQFLELPPELAAALDDLDCHYLLGMEWLKKNGFSAAENQAMVEANPFIPYSLLMSRGDFLRLQNS